MPRAVIDSQETVHLVFFQGVISSGDLWHVRRPLKVSSWSQSEKVNSQPHSVVGFGPIDGGQVVIDHRDRLHVVWFQSDPVRIFYTRTNSTGTGFEKQRSLWTQEEMVVETSPTVTVGQDGRVLVFWHAGVGDDASRSMYLATSNNGGAAFEPVRRVSTSTFGACGCCSPAAITDAAGTIYLSYRGASDNVQRGQRLMTIGKMGETLSDKMIHPWQINGCPVSTTTLSVSLRGTRVAWETQGQVYFADVTQLNAAVSPQGVARHRRKNPAIATNTQGETLLAWGDGPGLRAGGRLNWQLFNADARPSRAHGSDLGTIPSGSMPTVVAKLDGSFFVIF